jgi:hypothetical protein
MSWSVPHSFYKHNPNSNGKVSVSMESCPSCSNLFSSNKTPNDSPPTKLTTVTLNAHSTIYCRNICAITIHVSRLGLRCQNNILFWLTHHLFLGSELIIWWHVSNSTKFNLKKTKLYFRDGARWHNLWHARKKATCVSLGNYSPCSFVHKLLCKVANASIGNTIGAAPW